MAYISKLPLVGATQTSIKCSLGHWIGFNNLVMISPIPQSIVYFGIYTRFTCQILYKIFSWTKPPSLTLWTTHALKDGSGQKLVGTSIKTHLSTPHSSTIHFSLLYMLKYCLLCYDALSTPSSLLCFLRYMTTFGCIIQNPFSPPWAFCKYLNTLLSLFVEFPNNQSCWV